MSQLAQRLIMAAGGGKKTSTYIDDVFSTYLYKGNASGRAIENGLKLGNNNVGGSVEFQESSVDKLSFASTSDFTFGTGDFTIECFVNYNAISNDGIFQLSSTAGGITTGSALSLNVLSQDSGKYGVYFKNIQNITNPPGTCNNAVVNTGQWYHLAMVRQSGQSRFFVNGLAQVFGTDCTNDITITDTTNYTWTDLGLGGYYDNSFLLNGRISNFRITKGQALYWSNFTAPTQALTTTSQGATASNVKLLCCNKGTLTGKTVGPTITSSGSPTASGFGPFTGSGGIGGMVWIKDRTNAYNHVIQDTLRGAGATKKLSSNLGSNMGGGDNALEWAGYISAFNNNGFSLDKTGSGSIDWANVNKNNDEYASWAFAIQEGLLDIQTWDGNNTAGRQLPHNLGSVPGCIMVKSTAPTNNSGDWMVYHRDLGATHRIKLNTQSTSNTTASWNDVVPTSTHVTLGSNTGVNASGTSYVGYFFAGGASTAATARSVYFGGDASLEIPSSSDLTLGTGDFTIETWVYPQSFGNRSTIYDGRSSGGTTGITIGWEASSGQVRVYMNAANGSDIVVQSDDLEMKQWTHIAVTRSSGTVRLFINGTEKDSATRTSDLNNTNAKIIGFRSYTSSSFDHMHGRISNFRLVKGTAVYTSSFKPSTQPLTDITNTKLLCCNNVSVTGATVTPGTITVGTGGFAGNPVAYAENPFDDPEGFKFGEEGDQNIIKCGSFRGNHSSYPEVYLGWEPQFILYKNSNQGQDWFMLDSMRGISTGGNDSRLRPNQNYNDNTSQNPLELTSTGFKITTNDNNTNGNGETTVYIAIRMSDGYVGKPLTSTEAFDIKLMETNGTEPFYKTQNTTDMGIGKRYDTGSGQTDWFASSRFQLLYYNDTSGNNAQMANSYQEFDYQKGFNSYTGSWGDNIGFSWKRHTGFDMVAYRGVGPNIAHISHSLNKVPEMMWVKNRDQNASWQVYHNGINDGTNPQNYYLELNQPYPQDTGIRWYNTAPTSTHFTLGVTDQVNGAASNNYDYIAYLFATTDVSKVGYYTGSGGVGNPQSMGFQPRLVLIKNVTDNNTNWMLINSVHGFSKYLLLNTKDPFVTGTYISPSATGFSFTGGPGVSNELNKKYIYYAHA